MRPGALTDFMTGDFERVVVWKLNGFPLLGGRFDVPPTSKPSMAFIGLPNDGGEAPIVAAIELKYGVYAPPIGDRALGS